MPATSGIVAGQDHHHHQRQHSQSDPTIQLNFTRNNPDESISHNITYNAPPVWRHLLKKVENLFSINAETLQIIYLSDSSDGNHITVNSDHDLQAILKSATASDHVFKFMVRNMRSPTTPSKILDLPAHNELPSTKRVHKGSMYSFDVETSLINGVTPPDIINPKPRNRRSLSVNDEAHDEDYPRKQAQDNSILFTVPYRRPNVTNNSHVEWRREASRRISSAAALPTRYQVNCLTTSSPHISKPIQSMGPVSSPAEELVDGLDLDLGPPADSNAPSALGMHLGEGPSSFSAARSSFNSPIPARRFPFSQHTHPSWAAPAPIIPPLFPAPMPVPAVPALRVFIPRVSPKTPSPVRESRIPNSLGLGLDLPLRGIPIPNRYDSINSNNSSPHSLVSHGPTIPPSSPPSPADPVRKSLLFPAKTLDKSNQGIPGLFRESSVSSHNSVPRYVERSENILRTGYGSPSASDGHMSSEPLRNAADHYKADGSDHSAERCKIRPISTMRTETPPIITSARSKLKKHPETNQTAVVASKTNGNRRKKMQVPVNDVQCRSKRVSSSLSSSPSLHPNKVVSDKKKKKHFTPSPSQLKRPSAPVPQILNSHSKFSKSAKLPLFPTYHQASDPIPVDFGNTGSFSSTSTKQPMNTPDHIGPISVQTRPTTDPMAAPSNNSGILLVSEPTLRVLKSEIEEMVKREIIEGIKRAVEELKTELKHSIDEVLQTHRNEFREHLEQADGLFSERSRGYSQERPSYSASMLVPPPPPPPPPSLPHPPPFPSQSIAASVPSLHSYHPCINLPSSTLIFPFHHSHCDHALLTPSCSIPYHHRYTSTSLPTYTCCHGHPLVKPPEPSLNSNHHYSHQGAPPVPPAPPAPPAPAVPPSLHRQARWSGNDSVPAAPVYNGSDFGTRLGNNNPSVNTNGVRSEGPDGLARLRDIQERLKTLLEGEFLSNGNGLLGQQLQKRQIRRQNVTTESPESPPQAALASSSVQAAAANSHPQLTRKQSTSKSSVYSDYLIHCYLSSGSMLADLKNE